MYKKIKNKMFLRWERYYFYSIYSIHMSIYSNNIYFDNIKFVISHKKGEIDSYILNKFFLLFSKKTNFNFWSGLHKLTIYIYNFSSYIYILIL